MVLDIVKRLKLCTGVKGTTLKHSQISEVLTYQNDNYKCVKSQGCKRIVSFLGEKQCCNTCRQLQYTGKNSKIKFPSNIERADIEALVPNGSFEMVDLLLSQIKKTANRDKRQNKLTKSIIQTCLTLWSRSPKSYETLRSSGMLVLPSEYLLVLYKNCVNQITGFNDEVFTWMHNEAERLGIPQDGRVGGLIIDEMAIQSDLRIVTNGATVEFVGLDETLDESRSMKVIQQ